MTLASTSSHYRLWCPGQDIGQPSQDRSREMLDRGRPDLETLGTQTGAPVHVEWWIGMMVRLCQVSNFYQWLL